MVLAERWPMKTVTTDARIALKNVLFLTDFSEPSEAALPFTGAKDRFKGREIRCYDYVNHPYEHVRDALRQDALTVF
jgi:hypothetical protein